MRLGLMGGTFDPVHNTHLLIAELARAQFDLERVIWVPAGDPPHKKGYPVTPGEHRYAMVLLATASNPRFEASRLELERPGPSYSLDTILHFRACGADEVYFITGADAILEILTWHRHEEVVSACRFIAAARPGHDLSGISGLPPAYRERIYPLRAPCVDISSTGLRHRLAAGEPVRYMLPEEVEAYIRKHALYR